MYRSQYVISFSAENFEDLTDEINKYLAKHCMIKIISVSYSFADNKNQALVVFEER